ncbi:MAG TPA: halocarboxylic acid dehydrogenase DehI family protein [Vicinamibacterales bacterium]|nr:halocarboxylic acid dehydrogenase DehI family protein [Vicinamibacterales bacterium]
MFGSKPKPIAEHEARGDTARVYHEIRQTLRVSGVNLNFRTWAGFERFFPAMWSAMQPIAASQAFESGADEVRARAADLARELPALQVGAKLGDSQRLQIQGALALYHYINPKLLLFTVLVRRGLAGEGPGAASVGTELGPHVPFGAPARMAAMEMVDETPGDRRLRRIFRDIKKTMQLTSVNSDYRTLALWPDYLDPAWASLKRVVRKDSYQESTRVLMQAAAMAADRFPTPVSLDLRRLRSRGEDAKAVMEVTTQFERLLPPLILNIAVLARDWWPGDELGRSPFPIVDASARTSGASS